MADPSHTRPKEGCKSPRTDMGVLLLVEGFKKRKVKKNVLGNVVLVLLCMPLHLFSGNAGDGLKLCAG